LIPAIPLSKVTNLPPQVVYASINTTTEPEKTDDDGNTLSRRKSKTISQPIGTIRLVPFPHSPHPEPGSTWAPPLPSSETPSTPPYITDRATSLHDGREPYLKLGRLAVLKEFRGSGIAKILTNAAMTWARENPTYFNPSITEMGMDKIGVSRLEELPVWKGLICVHAQEQVVGTWKRWGFEVDEGMGRWDEEGIMHVGMFTRLPIGL
jgi:GNAT superfamily N-acetyltransferase